MVQHTDEDVKRAFDEFDAVGRRQNYAHYRQMWANQDKYVRSALGQSLEQEPKVNFLGVGLDRISAALYAAQTALIAEDFIVESKYWQPFDIYGNGNIDYFVQRVPTGFVIFTVRTRVRFKYLPNGRIMRIRRHCIKRLTDGVLRDRVWAERFIELFDVLRESPE